MLKSNLLSKEQSTSNSEKRRKSSVDIDTRKRTARTEKAKSFQRVLPDGKVFTDDDYGIRKVITVAESSDEDEMHHA